MLSTHSRGAVGPYVVSSVLAVLLAGAALCGCTSERPRPGDAGGAEASVSEPQVKAWSVLSAEEAEFAALVRKTFKGQPDFLRIDMPITVGWVNLSLDEPTARISEYFPIPVRYQGGGIFRLEVLGTLKLLKDWQLATRSAPLDPLSSAGEVRFEVLPIVAIPELVGADRDGPPDYNRYSASWYWYPTPLGTMPLSALESVNFGSSQMNPKGVVFSDTVPMKVVLRSTLSRVANTSRALLWWRSARGPGVSLPARPGAVLHLLTNTRFVHADIVFTVESVSNERVTLSAVHLLDLEFMREPDTGD